MVIFQLSGPFLAYIYVQSHSHPCRLPLVSLLRSCCRVLYVMMLYIVNNVTYLQLNPTHTLMWFTHKFYFLVPLGNIVGIAVGVSIAGIVLLVVLPIVICVVIGCCYSKHRSSRHSTVTTTTQPVPPTVTVNTTNIHSQQDGFQSHPVAGTGINQAPPQAFEMSAYPPTVQAAYPPPTHASYIPTYPPRQA